tara:strand:+ start:1288 stop:1503 length:216 start_codon:yes stop_codon:yes gene_type:complete
MNFFKVRDLYNEEWINLDFIEHIGIHKDETDPHGAIKDSYSVTIQFTSGKKNIWNIRKKELDDFRKILSLK